MTNPRETAIEAHIRQIAKRIDSSVALEPRTPLLAQQLLDSVELMELISALEQEFAIAIPLEELTPENFASIQAIAGLVERVERKDA